MIAGALREGTADLHASLESALPLGSIDLTLASYGQLLQGFRGYFAAWEQSAHNAAPAHLQDLLAERARTALLDRDLATLGQPPTPVLATDLPPLHPTAALLGSMYVLEGSRLGGQYLVRSLESRLGLTPEHGLAFFYGFGPQTGSRWKAFCEVLEQQVTDVTVDTSLSAARETFTSLHRWMVSCGIAALPRISPAESTL